MTQEEIKSKLEETLNECASAYREWYNEHLARHESWMRKVYIELSAKHENEHKRNNMNK